MTIALYGVSLAKVRSAFFGDSVPSHQVAKAKFGALVGQVKVWTFFARKKEQVMLFIGSSGADLEGMVKVRGEKFGQKSPHMKVIGEFSLREMT